ncbi:MAG: hypothetical protein K8T25_10025 [Planctomycetia bacterium]|nr:hypothetical protein [Planctomycetia bacterium]
MSDPNNPFASPAIAPPISVGAEWVGKASPELRRVGLGLLLVYAGICLVLLAAICLVGIVLFAGGLGRLGGRMPALFGLALMGMIIVGYLLQTIGPFFCLAVPSESGAKPLIITSVALMMLSLVPYGLTFVDAGPIASFVGGGGYLLSAVLFVLFLRKLALFIERPKLAGRAITVLVVAVVITLAFIGLVAAPFSGILLPPYVGYLAPVLALAALVNFILYANLINSLRKELRP